MGEKRVNFAKTKGCVARDGICDVRTERQTAAQKRSLPIAEILGMSSVIFDSCTFFSTYFTHDTMVTGAVVQQGLVHRALSLVLVVRGGAAGDTRYKNKKVRERFLGR